MFKNLANFGYKRNFVEALGFYLAYLVLVVVICGIAGGLFGAVMGNDTFEFGMRIGGVVAIVLSMSISFLILSKKKLMGNFGYLLLALLSGLLAAFGGGVLGLIPAAYLSSR